MLDSLISKENLDLLDSHAATLDRISSLLSKVEGITNSPLLQQITQLGAQVMEQKAGVQVTDPWDGPTMGALSGTAPPPMTTQAPLQSISPAVQQPINQPVAAYKSEVHKNMHDAIEQMTEEELMAFINQGEPTNEESKPDSTEHKDSECDTEDN